MPGPYNSSDPVSESKGRSKTRFRPSEHRALLWMDATLRQLLGTEDIGPTSEA